MSTGTENLHLTDTELFRVLDGGAVDTDRTTHLAGCGECGDALASLQEDSERVTAALLAADFEDGGRPVPDELAIRRAVAAGADRAGQGPGPTSSGANPVADAGSRRILGSPWLKAAAILVLVAGPLAAFPDVRYWVVERVTGGPEAGTEAVPADAEPRVLRFTPDPGAFTIRFPADATGAIVLERTSAAQAELRSTGGEPETVVSSSSLEIRNPDAGRYELRLPASVTGAWIVVGERAVAVNDRQIDRRTVVDLGG